MKTATFILLLAALSTPIRAARADDCASWRATDFPPPQHCAEYPADSSRQAIVRMFGDLGMSRANAFCVAWHLENYPRSTPVAKATELATKWCNALGAMIRQ